MSTFERIHYAEPLREWDVSRENPSIEMSDADYLQRLRRDTHALDVGSNIMNAIRIIEPKKRKRTKKGVV